MQKTKIWMLHTPAQDLTQSEFDAIGGLFCILIKKGYEC